MFKDIAFVDLAAQRERLGSRMQVAIQRVLDHGEFIMGPEVAQLEERLQSFCGARHAVTCSSGTDALYLALRALEIGRGDAVFVPSFTFSATGEAVVLAGATPIFVDVHADTFNIDCDSLNAAIKETISANRLTPRAIMSVDMFGQPADYTLIRQVATVHNLHLIADAAQSFGATWNGENVGTLGDVTTTSFYPAKPLGCYGDGGAVLTNDDSTADALRSLRVHGMGVDKFDNVTVGINGRLDTLQASILLEKLAIFEDELKLRDQVANSYSEQLEQIVECPQLAARATSSWAQYTVKVPNRDQLQESLRDLGIPTAVFYRKPMHLQGAYASYPQAPTDLVNSENLPDSVLSLPMHPYMDQEQQERIINAVKACTA